MPASLSAPMVAGRRRRRIPVPPLWRLALQQLVERGGTIALPSPRPRPSLEAQLEAAIRTARGARGGRDPRAAGGAADATRPARPRPDAAALGRLGDHDDDRAGGAGQRAA